jgi:hypothetical protein
MMVTFDRSGCWDGNLGRSQSIVPDGSHIPNSQISLYFGQIRDKRGRNNRHQDNKPGDT